MNKDSSNNAPDFLNIANRRLARRRTVRSGENSADTEIRTPHVVFCGGFHSSMLGLKAVALERFCEQQSWSYTRFDYAGHGESDGEAAAFTLSDWLDDVLCILDDSEGPVLLLGSSMGGWLATLAACRRPDKVRGLLLLAAAPDFLQELIQPRLSASDIWDLQQGKVVLLPNAYADPYPITQALLDSGTPLSVLSNTSQPDQPKVDSLSCPVRLIHGTADTDVPHTLSLRLMEKISHPDAHTNLLHQADHRLSDERALSVMEKTLTELSHAMATNGTM